VRARRGGEPPLPTPGHARDARSWARLPRWAPPLLNPARCEQGGQTDPAAAVACPPRQALASMSCMMGCASAAGAPLGTGAGCASKAPAHGATSSSCAGARAGTSRKWQSMHAISAPHQAADGQTALNMSRVLRFIGRLRPGLLALSTRAVVRGQVSACTRADRLFAPWMAALACSATVS
jgi:hypothetical protein